MRETLDHGLAPAALGLTLHDRTSNAPVERDQLTVYRERSTRLRSLDPLLQIREHCSVARRHRRDRRRHWKLGFLAHAPSRTMHYRLRGRSRPPSNRHTPTP